MTYTLQNVTEKTAMLVGFVIFLHGCHAWRHFIKSKQKKLEGDLKIKLCGKRLYPTESVKYLGVKIDANLTWQHHVNDLSIKLNRANAVLLKMRKYVSLKILRSIYFAIFHSYLSYCCLVWAQNFSTIQ